MLAEDGQKMSKRLKNYPEPDNLLETFGADALRAFSSIRHWSGAIRSVSPTTASGPTSARCCCHCGTLSRFLSTFAEADGITAADLKAARPLADRPELDRWIVSLLPKH